MDKDFIIILQKLVKEKGKEVLFEGKKCKNILDDYARGEYKKEIQWLLLAIEENVHIEIERTDGLELCKKKQIRRLDELGWKEEIAIFIVDLLALVLRGDKLHTNIIDEKITLSAKNEAYKEYREINKKDSVIISRQASSYYTSSNKINEYKENNIINFGEYQWIVLEVKYDRILIITKNSIEEQPYHQKLESITWEYCSLRLYYLRDKVYDSFNQIDKSRIIEVTNCNPDNYDFGTFGCKPTKDKIFLLSIDEVKKYFKSDIERVSLFRNETASFWWLRTPGASSEYASCVSHWGVISNRGYPVSTYSGGIRPALWLRI